ncbi:hypothetical protein G9A89_018138 [Geosiphon pyriformis]|nr:hypothetical protein G9A89_018138 [Geosiphon pyriformis]
MAPQQFFHALSNDFGSLFNTQKFSDVRIIVGEAPNIRTFHAHSQILAARSPYFAVALSGNWIKRENNTIIFNKPNISPNIFEIILRYIYNGEISLDKHAVPTILELLVTADELILEKIIDLLEDYLIEHHAKELEENFATLQKTSFMHDSFKKLQNFCTEIIVNNSAIVFNSQDFNSLNGFTPADFHRLCDDKGATVSVIKVKGTGQLIGGYNPQSWHSKNAWLQGEGSFIFSLGDGNAGNAKLSKFVGAHGPYDGSHYGPNFGSRDIWLSGNDYKSRPRCFCSNTTDYEHAIMPGSENQQVNFFVEEYEVFQIIKR